MQHTRLAAMDASVRPNESAVGFIRLSLLYRLDLSLWESREKSWAHFCWLPTPLSLRESSLVNLTCILQLINPWFHLYDFTSLRFRKKKFRKRNGCVLHSNFLLPYRKCFKNPQVSCFVFRHSSFLICNIASVITLRQNRGTDLSSIFRKFSFSLQDR